MYRLLAAEQVESVMSVPIVVWLIESLSAGESGMTSELLEPDPIEPGPENRSPVGRTSKVDVLSILAIEEVPDLVGVTDVGDQQ